ncbi:hypothetical protein ACP70R_014953 [Stipagrostis hirtigluma subsp. patula]
MDQTVPISSPRNNEDTGMEQVFSDLKSLKSLYGLLHNGPADENLDDKSKALLMKMLDDATQQALVRQAKMLPGSLNSPALERKLSIRSDRRTIHAEPRLGLKPPASPTPSLTLNRQASERSRRLNLQNSVSSRRVDGHRHAEEEPVLARLASNRSSRTAMLPPRPQPIPEQNRLARLASHRSSLVGMPPYDHRRRGTVAGSSRHEDNRDRPRHRSGHGDPSSPELMNGRSSVSREPSLDPARHAGAEGASSTRRFGRLDSGLSMSLASPSRRFGRLDSGLSVSLVSPSRRFGRLDSGLSVATSRYLSGRVDGHRHAEEEPVLARLASNRSSRTAMPSPRPQPIPEQNRLARLASHRSSLLGVPPYDADHRQHGTVAGSSQNEDHRDRPRHLSSHGDPSSPEPMSGRRSVESVLDPARLHGRATARHVGAEGGSSTRTFRRLDSGLSVSLASPTRRFGRLDSGLSVSLASPSPSRRFGRLDSGLSVATPRYLSSSSSNTMVTIHSRIRPHRELTGRSLRRAEEDDDEEESTPRRRWKGGDASSAGTSSSRRRRAPTRIDSGSMYSSRHEDHRDMPRRRSIRGDQSSLATARRVGAKGGGSSTRHFGRLDSGLSVSPASGRFGRLDSGLSMASPRYLSSSSSNTKATIRSRIRPHQELTGRFLRRDKEEDDEEESAPRRRRKGGPSSAGKPSTRRRRALSRIDSGSMYGSGTTGAASSFRSASPTVSPASSDSASSYSSPVSRPASMWPVSRGASMWPPYAPESPGASRSRRRQERRERRVGRVRQLKSMIGTVFHHLHDHHHHHHHFQSGQEGPSSRSADVWAHHRKSPLQYLGGVFRRKNGKDEKKSTSQTVAGLPEKRRGGGGPHKPALFGAMVQHLQRTRRKAPAHLKKAQKGSMTQAKKLPALFGTMVQHLRRKAPAHLKKAQKGIRQQAKKLPGLPKKRRSGGRRKPSLFGAMMQHLRRTRRKAPAHFKKARPGSWLKAKKQHWWQRLGPGRKKSRHRLGHGK